MTSQKFELFDSNYQNSERNAPSHKIRTRYFILALGIAIALLLIVLGLSIATLIKVHQKNEAQDSSTLASTLTTTTATALDISTMIINEFKAENIEASLKVLSSKMHRAGTDEGRATADWIARQYRNFGLDVVEQPEYNVLLSYPNNTDTNKIWLVANDGTETLVSDGLSENLSPGDNASEYANVLFNGFGAAGDVKGELIYVNYGRFEDYLQLQNMNISLRDKIVIARYGKNYRGAKAQFAQQLGAVGVIIYNDPFDFSSNFTNYNETLPHSLWLPPKGAQRGSVVYAVMNGDFPTPMLPAKDYTYRIPIDELKDQLVLPRIPITPIGYQDASKLLMHMEGPIAPADWQGTAPSVGTYHLGPLKNGTKVHLKVNNYLDTRTIRNTIGYITGAEEPEKYVLLGNHYDSWVYGAMDPNSGTSVIIETARVFKAVMNATGWRPRRTLVFCSWDSEEYGLIGSNEWVEENTRRLQNRAIAYLNVDPGVSGNLTFAADSVPLLHKVILDSCKKISNPNPDEIAQGRRTVYDTFKYYKPNPNCDDPEISLVGSGKDYTRFLDYAGIPSTNIEYTGTWGRDFPIYHTMYETPWAYSNLLDQGFNYSRAIGQVWAEIARSLADSVVIPFDALDYANNVKKYVDNLVLTGDQQNIAEIIAAKQNLLNKTLQFVKSAKAVNDSIMDIKNSNNKINIRILNEKLQYLERMFIVPKGLPQHPLNRHVVFSPSATNAYAGSVFSGVFDALTNTRPPQINFIQQPTDGCTYNWTETLKEQLAWVTFCIDQAADWLRRDF